MKTLTSFIGILGAGLAIGGLILYSLAPSQLWLVTLCEALGLLCLMGFFVYHFETVKTFSAKRSTRLGLNSILMVILFIGILIIVNFLASRHSYRWDLSELQHFTLAPQSYDVVRGLKRDVKVTIFTQGRSPAFQAYRDLLESYQQATTRLKVEYVDPEQRPAVARDYGISQLDTAVFESGGNTSRVTGPSEAELTSALIRVSKDQRKQIVFLEGHGERDFLSEERDGYSLVREALVNQGYEVDTLMLLLESQIPKSTSVLIVAGPQQTITLAEQKRIAAYVEQGGRALFLIDPETSLGLNHLFNQWGVTLGAGTLIDLQDKLAQGDMTALLVRTFTEHEITHDFKTPVLFPVSRHVSLNDGEDVTWNGVPLARTSPESWAEMRLEGGKVVNKDLEVDIPGPLSVAVALTPKAAPPEGQPRGSVVVVGNSAFASNTYLNFPGNRDFFLHTIAWLAEERNLMSITPKEPAFRPFIPNATQERIILYVQVLFLPAITFLWGITVWRKRRHL